MKKLPIMPLISEHQSQMSLISNDITDITKVLTRETSQAVKVIFPLIVSRAVEAAC